jgi:hypothetical protein
LAGKSVNAQVVYREDCLLPLTALSNNADARPYVAAMARVQSRSAAFEEDLQSHRLGFPERPG